KSAARPFSPLISIRGGDLAASPSRVPRQARDEDYLAGHLPFFASGSCVWLMPRTIKLVPSLSRDAGWHGHLKELLERLPDPAAPGSGHLPGIDTAPSTP